MSEKATRLSIEELKVLVAPIADEYGVKKSISFRFDDPRGR